MRVALIGNQNSGKTTLFNLLTGTNQKVGNWPGVTIEKKSGRIRQTEHELIDLPGIYGLSPYSFEEEISRSFLLNEQIDLIINIVDATSLERSLYLTTQLTELNIPMVLALNMSDLISRRGIQIDIPDLEKHLGIPIVPISALKKTGILELIKRIDHNHFTQVKLNLFDPLIEKAITQIEGLVEHGSPRFKAIKYIEEDALFSAEITAEIQSVIDDLKQHFKKDLEQVIVDQRYRFIVNLRDQSIFVCEQNKTVTDKIDDILLNKYLAIPIFMVVMFSIYFLAAGPIGQLTVDWVGTLMENLKDVMTIFLQSVNASSWAISLVVDGIMQGVGAILGFLPQLIILFFMIAVLETTGYMSRIAFFLDKVFQKVGLSGKSLIPFIIGSGCSVPAILSARTIHDETEKKMTIMLTPFIPCSAKLPIITLFAGYFFKDYSGLISASLYFLSIAVIILSALIMKKVLFKGNVSSFISELPAYKAPNLSYIFYDVLGKVKAFVERAGSIILLASIILWVLISFSFRLQYGVDINQSILSHLGRLIAWVFYPILGTFSWEASVSAIQGLVAKEQVISSMAIISGLSETVDEGLLLFGGSAFAFFTPASAYAFMVFNLFSAPCFGAIGAMKQELGSTKQMLFAVLFQTGIAWLLAVFMYQLISLIGVIL
jgi:ferrous iron transport protein B